MQRETGTDNGDVKTQIQMLFGMITQVQGKLVDNEEHKNSTASLRQEHSDAINSISDTIMDLTKQVKYLNQQVLNQQTMIDSLNQQVQKHQEDIDRVKAKGFI